jgi:hypothetical protein
MNTTERERQVLLDLCDKADEGTLGPLNHVNVAVPLMRRLVRDAVDMARAIEWMKQQPRYDMMHGELLHGTGRNDDVLCFMWREWKALLGDS